MNQQNEKRMPDHIQAKVKKDKIKHDSGKANQIRA